MSNLTQAHRQAILNRMYTHFIVDRQPAGRVGDGANCVYHGADHCGRRVSCGIGIFDTDGLLADLPVINSAVTDLDSCQPDVLAAVFGVPDLGDADVAFLDGVQSAHDRAVEQVACTRQLFDVSFRGELERRLGLFAYEQGLDQPFATIG